MCVNFSIILLRFEINEIGLKFEHSSFDRFLETGKILAIFSLSGKIPDKKEILKSADRLLAIHFFATLISLFL